MAVPEAWQLPSVDDVDPDSLEYLFGPKGARAPMQAPWVKVAKEPEPVARISPEMIRLQSKVELLLGQMELVLQQLSQAHHELGYTKAQLASQEEELQKMAEYRVRAAKAVASDVEREKLRIRVSELEDHLSEVLRQNAAPANSVKPQEPVAVFESAPSITGANITAAKAVKSGIPSAYPADETNSHNANLERLLAKHAVDPSLCLPLMPLTYALFLCFAACVLLTIWM